MVVELAPGDLPDWVHGVGHWSMGSIQDPKNGRIHTRAARRRAKCAFLTSYFKNPLRLDLSVSNRKKIVILTALDVRIVGIVCIEQR